MRIVVGVDGSLSSCTAVAWGSQAARALDAEVLLVTAVPPGTDMAAWERLLLGTWSLGAQRAKVPFRTEVLTGDPREVLTDAVAGGDAALLVLGAGNERWFPALHLGSTSHYVAQHAEQPVAVVPVEHDRFDAAHIVVGVDGSPGSAAAAHWAATVARAVGGDVTAVHAWQRSPARLCHAVQGVSSAEEAERACRAWCGELDGVLRAAVAVEADTVDALTKTVEATGAGLLVLGTRGAGGFHGLRLGSVALRSLQGARVPVILVPPVT